MLKYNCFQQYNRLFRGLLFIFFIFIGIRIKYSCAICWVLPELKQKKKLILIIHWIDTLLCRFFCCLLLNYKQYKNNFSFYIFLKLCMYNQRSYIYTTIAIVSYSLLLSYVLLDTTHVLCSIYLISLQYNFMLQYKLLSIIM